MRLRLRQVTRSERDCAAFTLTQGTAPRSVRPVYRYPGRPGRWALLRRPVPDDLASNVSCCFLAVGPDSCPYQAAASRRRRRFPCAQNSWRQHLPSFPNLQPTHRRRGSSDLVAGLPNTCPARRRRARAGCSQQRHGGALADPSPRAPDTITSRAALADTITSHAGQYHIAQCGRRPRSVAGDSCGGGRSGPLEGSPEILR